MTRTLKTSTTTPTIDPSISFKPTVIKKHDPKASPLDKRFMPRTLKTTTCKPTIMKNHDPKASPLDKRFRSRTLKTTTCKPTITKNHDPCNTPTPRTAGDYSWRL